MVSSLARGALTIVCLACLIQYSSDARGAVTPTAHWRLGEDDGVIPNDPCLPYTIDAVGGLDLELHGGQLLNGAIYSSDTPPGSALALTVTNAAPIDPCYLAIPNDPCFGAVQNFGLEMWVRPSSPSVAALAYNGLLTQNGFGLYQLEDEYFAFLGSLPFGGAPVALNQWTHLALVVEQGGGVREGTLGVATLYVNGTPFASEVLDSPLVPASGGFSVAARDGGADPFSGSLDEVRTFGFQAGRFSPADLLYVPEPASAVYLLPALAVLASFAAPALRIRKLRCRGAGAAIRIAPATSSKTGARCSPWLGSNAPHVECRGHHRNRPVSVEPYVSRPRLKQTNPQPRQRRLTAFAGGVSLFRPAPRGGTSPG